MTDSASIRFRVDGAALVVLGSVGHLLEALPQRREFTRQELIREAERLGWHFEAELPVEGVESEILYLFGRGT